MGIENLNKVMGVDIKRNKKNKKSTLVKVKRMKIAKDVIGFMNNESDEINVKKLTKLSGLSHTAVKRTLQSEEFGLYLANAGLNRSEAAEMLVNKLKQHYALPAGDDKMFKDLMDMVLKSMGVYSSKQEIVLDKTPESLTLVRQLIRNEDGIYDEQIE